MVLDADAAYLAVKARDARFDGRLFVGVTSTGVYCRPVCRVRTPRRENCRFFESRALAEAATFRPCLKCRPEIAPGLSQMDSSRTLADTAAVLVEQSVHDGEALSLPSWPPGWVSAIATCGASSRPRMVLRRWTT
jgi:AraC family transcriptional regulator of adaptative response / DNA-3-methyladenine glycosylase II